jgi:Ca-activated chloride channel homolog
MKAATCLLLLSSIFFASLAVSAQSQKKDEDEVVRVDTQLVDVPIVVTDKTGKPLLNLKRMNFTVYEDGKKQDILDFSATNAPFEVALLLDTSGSTRSDLQLIQRAAQQFLASLRPGDRVAVIAYNTERAENRSTAVSEILSPLTDSRVSLKAAIEQVRTSNGTPYYDSVLQIAENVFGNKPAEEFRGRRALVALTDGVDSTSLSDFSDVKQTLENAGVISFFIQVDTRPFFEENLLGDCESAIRFSQAQIRRYYKSFSPRSNLETTSDFCKLGDFERLAISKKLYEIAGDEMNTLAKSSGGKVFPVGDLNDARAAFKSVADEIGTKYSLGYYSSNEKRDGTYRKIKVDIKGLPAGVQVRAREGYTAPIK